MRYRDAAKLHNGDEVLLKIPYEGTEICTVDVITVGEKEVTIWAMTPKYGYCGLPHTRYA